MRGFVIMRGMRSETRGEQLTTFVVRWLITAVAVWVASELVGGIHLDGWESTLIVALILGLLNAYIKPLLVFLSFPVLIMTLGLFLIIVNTALLGLTAWIAGKFDSIHFDIDSFGAALLGAIIISIVSWLISLFINPSRVGRSFG